METKALPTNATILIPICFSINLYESLFLNKFCSFVMLEWLQQRFSLSPFSHRWLQLNILEVGLMNLPFQCVFHAPLKVLPWVWNWWTLIQNKQFMCHKKFLLAIFQNKQHLITAFCSYIYSFFTIYFEITFHSLLI